MTTDFEMPSQSVEEPPRGPDRPGVKKVLAITSSLGKVYRSGYRVEMTPEAAAARREIEKLEESRDRDIEMARSLHYKRQQAMDSSALVRSQTKGFHALGDVATKALELRASADNMAKDLALIHREVHAIQVWAKDVSLINDFPYEQHVKDASKPENAKYIGDTGRILRSLRATRALIEATSRDLLLSAQIQESARGQMVDLVRAVSTPGYTSQQLQALATNSEKAHKASFDAELDDFLSFQREQETSVRDPALPSTSRPVAAAVVEDYESSDDEGTVES